MRQLSSQAPPEDGGEEERWHGTENQEEAKGPGPQVPNLHVIVRGYNCQRTIVGGKNGIATGIVVNSSQLPAGCGIVNCKLVTPLLTRLKSKPAFQPSNEPGFFLR